MNIWHYFDHRNSWPLLSGHKFRHIVSGNINRVTSDCVFTVCMPSISYTLSREYRVVTLHWRHDDHDGVSNHQPHGCLLNRLFGRRSKKTSKLRVTALHAGNSPGSVNSPHKGPVTRKMFPFDDVIMRNRFSCLLFTCEIHLCPILRMQEQPTNMTYKSTI